MWKVVVAFWGGCDRCLIPRGAIPPGFRPINVARYGPTTCKVAAGPELVLAVRHIRDCSWRPQHYLSQHAGSAKS